MKEKKSRKPRKLKFTVWPGANGEWYFHLKAVNGRKLFHSEGYKTEASALKTIEVIQMGAGGADIVRLDKPLVDV